MPTPQLVSPHKYDTTDKTPSTGTDAELRAVVVDMLKQGASEDEVSAFVRKADALKDPTSARINGALAGVGPGLLTGLIGIPLMLKDAVLDGVSMLQGRDPENAKAFIESMHSFVPKLKNADPYEQAKMVSELATSFGTGSAMGGGAFAARKPLAQAAGTGLMKAVEHPAGVRLTSGSAMLGGIYTGNPAMVAAGAAGAALPDVAEGAGRTLYKYGSGAEYVSPKQATAFSKLNDRFKEAMSTRNGTFADEQSAAALEARKAAEVMAAKMGLEPGVPSVRTSLSAKDPNGGRTSVSQSFKAPGANSKIAVPTGLTADEEKTFREIKALNDQVPDAAIVAGIRGTKVAPIANVTPAGRPAIRVSESAPTSVAPVERRTRVSQSPNGVERRLGPTADDLPPMGTPAERAAFMRKENPSIDQDAAAMRARAAESKRGGTAVLEAPAEVSPATGVPDNYMTDTDVSNIGGQAAKMGDQTLETLRAAGADVPVDGLQSSSDIDRVVQSLPKPAPVPKNLEMGSQASAKEIAADVRVRAQGGGGIRIDGSRPGQPISLVKGQPVPLTQEAVDVLKQYLAENPEMDPAIAESHLRKLMGSEE